MSFKVRDDATLVIVYPRKLWSIRKIFLRAYFVAVL